MAPRLELQQLLVDLLGSTNVYFQAPENMKIEYPCIVYKRDRIQTQFADGLPYNRKTRYELTVIDLDPDSVIPDKVAALPTCSHTRSFVTENLNHDVFSLFF